MSSMMPIRSRKDGRLITVAMLMSIIMLLLTGNAEALRKPSANRECATCHIMWLDEFKRKDVKTLIPYDPQPVVATGKQDVASTEQMCFSCHDGFVLDSRFLWKKDHYSHPVGVKPSQHVSIPTAKGKTIFPLNVEGKIYCGTCHTAHGVDWQSKDSPIFLRMENKNSSLCVACHLNRSTGVKDGNHPVGLKLKHPPDVLKKANAKFGKKGEVVCQSCHVVHAAKGKKILARKNNDSQLCSSCHEKNKAVRSSKHNLAKIDPDVRNERGQKVSEAGPCSACHVPHKANGPRLWSRTLQAGKDLGSAYCLSCHDRGGVAGKKTIGKHTHPVDVPLRRAGIVAKKDGWLSDVNNKAAPAEIVRLPLFNKQGKRVKVGGNVTCLSCHDPHLWSSDHAQQANPGAYKLEGDGRNSFLRIANDKNSALCVNCHRDKAPVVLSKHNLDISAANEKNAQDMTVSHSGTCSACHVPHNGEGNRMWARRIGSGGQDIKALCVDCHRQDGIAENKTIGTYSHPVQVNLKKTGLHTRLPLFSSSGERDDKRGLVDCATCHNPHQWDPGNASARSGMNPKTDGDSSNSFLRKKASGKATLCIDCHKQEKTVIASDHDMTVTAADAHNSKGQTVKQSGPCGQCHAVHNADSPLRLWSRKTAEGTDRAQALCLSCHRKDGVAQAKVPEKLEHPDRTVPSNIGRLRANSDNKMVAPVFNNLGKHGNAGSINCITCHNPHRWDAGSSKAGSGKNEEGNVSNSFLRHSSSEFFLCADCHGEDSIYRYKYFHWSKSRQEKSK